MWNINIKLPYQFYLDEHHILLMTVMLLIAI